jgi:hypothetical protein
MDTQESTTQLPNLAEAWPPGLYQPCEHCQSPLDEHQRYCVSCGTRRRDANDPAARYLAARRTRSSAGAGSGASPSRPNLVLAALFFALLPAAAAVGVLAGKHNGSTDPGLLDALRHQPQTVAAASAQTFGTAAAASSATPVRSDFTLASGYTVRLTTLPTTSSSTAVARAEQAARSRGATQVGVISPRDFKTTPDQGNSNYVLFSGQFATRAQAERNLARLRRSFPGAQVLAVRSTKPTAAAAAPPIVAQGAFGVAHKVTGFRPTPQKIASDKQVVQRINTQVGRNYVNAEKNLPDTIVVTGNGNNSADSTTNQGQGQP